MGYFCALMFVLQIVRIFKAEPTLEIVKNVHGTVMPISNVSRESAGTNLTLICKLRNSTDNDTSKYFDNEVSWGWRRENVQFNNLTDLQKLISNSRKPLLQFLNKSELNQAIIRFQPLSQVDSGHYFCMSLKYKLFNIVKIEVKDSFLNTLSRHNARSWLYEYTQNNSIVFAKSYCRKEMFTCNSRTQCINQAYMCDNVKDCNDGSDENFYLCGSPCAGKTKCSNGRCISQSLCCADDAYFRCLNSGPSCCSEIVRANKLFNMVNTKTSNGVSINTFRLSSFDLPRLNNDRWSSHGNERFKGIGEYPSPKNSYGSKINYSPKVNSFSSITTTTTKSSFKVGKKILWIFLAPFIAIGAAVRCIARKCKGKGNSGTSNTENIISPSSNLYQEVYASDNQQVALENTSRNSDLPPSYDDTVKKSLLRAAK